VNEDIEVSDLIDILHVAETVVVIKIVKTGVLESTVEIEVTGKESQVEIEITTGGITRIEYPVRKQKGLDLDQKSQNVVVEEVQVDALKTGKALKSIETSVIVIMKRIDIRVNLLKRLKISGEVTNNIQIKAKIKLKRKIKSL